MPLKRKVTHRKINSLELKKREKHQAFLKDFDLEVDRRKREMEKALNSLLIQIDANYSRAIMKLPLAVRQMNNLDYFALGGSADAVAEIEQKRINADCLEVEAIESEILKDATQLKTTRKCKQKTKHVDDAANDGEDLPPSSKMFRKKRINADCLEVEAIESEILKDATQLKTTRKCKQKTKHVDDAANDGEDLPPSSKMFRKDKSDQRAELCKYF
ncbi:borealin-like [Amblyraja radiata]|uniref:borealin-like n=1 Tax=Amblyraja radiata TaxID=386614 RepID=UPI001402025B|nr:borealin-like [Amblyraja radiata]